MNGAFLNFLHPQSMIFREEPGEPSGPGTLLGGDDTAPSGDDTTSTGDDTTSSGDDTTSTGEDTAGTDDDSTSSGDDSEGGTNTAPVTMEDITVPEGFEIPEETQSVSQPRS